MMLNSWRWLGVALLSCAVLANATDDKEITHLLDPGGDRVPLQTMAPLYPERAIRDRLEGDVEVCFHVDRDGRTSRIAVRHSTHRLFEKPAIQAVRASSYEPLGADDALSNIKTCRIFRFRLDPVAIEDPPPRSG